MTPQLTMINVVTSNGRNHAGFQVVRNRRPVGRGRAARCGSRTGQMSIAPTVTTAHTAQPTALKPATSMITSATAGVSASEMLPAMPTTPTAIGSCWRLTVPGSRVITDGITAARPQPWSMRISSSSAKGLSGPITPSATGAAAAR